MKKCSRCGTELTHGQRLCHHCGKPQERLRRVRCQKCGSVSDRSLEVCPTCGETLRQDWVRPLLIGLAFVAVLILALVVGPRLARQISGWQPGQAVGTVQALVDEMPVLVDIPTLTPSLTPSPTPTPTSIPTQTAVPTSTPPPTLTPTPTLTPSPTATYTPTPTPTNTRRPATRVPPTNTPLPVPTAAPPLLTEPEDGTSYGTGGIIRLAWQSNHLLSPDQCFLIKIRYTHQQAEVILPTCVQQTYWFVDEALYLQADQETDRVYYWTVQVVRKETDADGTEVYTALGPPSEERSFHWR